MHVAMVDHKVYTLFGDFEWHITKAARNLEKHKISFHSALSAFADISGYFFIDLKHSSMNEIRWNLIARSDNGILLSICFTMRKDPFDHESKTTRIISARKANWKEKKVYYGPNDAR